MTGSQNHCMTVVLACVAYIMMLMQQNGLMTVGNSCTAMHAMVVKCRAGLGPCCILQGSGKHA